MHKIQHSRNAIIWTCLNCRCTSAKVVVKFAVCSTQIRLAELVASIIVQFCHVELNYRAEMIWTLPWVPEVRPAPSALNLPWRSAFGLMLRSLFWYECSDLSEYCLWCPECLDTAEKRNLDAGIRNFPLRFTGADLEILWGGWSKRWLEWRLKIQGVLHVGHVPQEIINIESLLNIGISCSSSLDWLFYFRKLNDNNCDDSTVVMMMMIMKTIMRKCQSCSTGEFDKRYSIILSLVIT